MPKRAENNQKKQGWSQKKYLLVLRNEENLREQFPFRGKGWQLTTLAATLLTIIVALSMIISVATYAYWTKNYSDEAALRSRLLQLSYLTDSIQSDLLAHQYYLRSLRAVFEGNTAYLRESTPYRDTKDTSFTAPYNFNNSSLFTSTARPNQIQAIEPTSNYDKEVPRINRYLFPPIKGYISDRYAEHEAHYGIDLLAPKGTTVQATATGVVVFASWTQDGGYVIALQHKKGLASFYKHNEDLLKQVGETAYIGDPIAVIGNTGSLSTGPHLHFELWQDGKPIDPEQLISFQ